VYQANAALAHHGNQIAIAQLEAQIPELSLKLKYQRTHNTTISRLKWRPLNSSSTGTNRGIWLSSLIPVPFAPEPVFFRASLSSSRKNAVRTASKYQL
jgi:hypothetical protein